METGDFDTIQEENTDEKLKVARRDPETWNLLDMGEWIKVFATLIAPIILSVLVTYFGYKVCDEKNYNKKIIRAIGCFAYSFGMYITTYCIILYFAVFLLLTGIWSP